MISRNGGVIGKFVEDLEDDWECERFLEMGTGLDSSICIVFVLCK